MESTENSSYHFLTVRLPWPYLIFVEKNSPAKPKRIETRTWRPEDYGLTPPFQLGIHAGKKIDWAVVEYLQNKFNLEVAVDPSDAGLVFGMVEVTKVEKYTPETWQAQKPLSYGTGDLPTDKDYFAWYIEKPKRLDQKLPAVGRYGIYSLPKSSFLHLTSHETK